MARQRQGKRPSEAPRSPGSGSPAWPVLSRSVAAVFGGYCLAHTLPIALFAAMPLARAEAALFAIQLSFLVYTGAVLWAFAARSAVAAWLGLLLPTAVTGLLAWALT